MTKSPLRLVVNNAVQGFNRITGQFFGMGVGTGKHDYNKDFGFPDTIGFAAAFQMYRRNGVARAAVDKTAAKTWQTFPVLQEFKRDSQQDAPETLLEKAIRTKFDDIRLWQAFKDCDRRFLVGSYSGLILRISDGQTLDKPVARPVAGGLDAIVEVIPAWEGQLTVDSYDENQASPTYGMPTMFQFNESKVYTGKTQVRSARVHPDRVIIWSEDGKVGGVPRMDAGYNDLITIQKIIGAGGEGFWKNAKGSPVIEINADQSVENIAKASGVAPDEFVEKMNEQVSDFQKGFDEVLMGQGMTIKPFQVNLADPLNFFSIALQSFCASWDIPAKVLVGAQTGERASTEDAGGWNETNDGRRTDIAVPGINVFIRRMEEFGILADKDWHLQWTSLLDGSPQQKMDRAYKMADINQKMKDSAELVYSHDEIRQITDFAPRKTVIKTGLVKPTDTPSDVEDDPSEPPKEDEKNV